MNANRYRLVFDETRGMLVPVCENMPSHGKRVGGEAAAVCLTVLLGVFGLGGVFAAGDAAAQTTQRVIPAALAAIARPAAGYVPPTSAFAGNGYGSYTATGSYGEVTQTALRAIFNWSNLNIGKGGHVHFNQVPGGSAVNKIGSADPTVIDGMLTATGQIYLINQNGILFGGGAQVNVGGLVASTLNISDEVFQKGWLSQQGRQATFAFEGTAEQFQSSFVRVEAGATLASAESGGIYMFAPRVENAGQVETPGGQAMLAAGSKVYLAAPTDARMRGFLVEVDPFVGKDAGGNNVNVGGSVAVDKVGEIIARRGNITLAGLAVNHAGRMRATTTVDANGSIFVKARDTAAEITVELRNKTNPALTDKVLMTESTRGGDATLEAGSVIEIVNEKAATERLIADSRTLRRSLVEVTGKHIVLEGRSGDSAGARIAAKSGEINLVTAYNGLLPLDGMKTVEADQRIFLGAGSSIDASGLKNVAAPISRNIVEVELRGDELKDSPLLRSALSGTKVRVDVRKGTKVADVSGYVDKIERTIDEKSTVGGAVVLRSDGDVVIREKASIDVSGGSIDYSKGNTATSYLTWEGGSDAIESARTDRRYTGAYDVVREELAYSEGKDAGSIGIFGKRLALAGDLKGGVTPGVNQRASGKVPKAATLELDNKTLKSYDADKETSTWRYDGLAQTVRFINGTADLSSIGATTALPEGFRLDLSGDMLTAGGFAGFNLNTTGRVEVPASVTLGVQAGGRIDLKGSSAAIDGMLQARGGSLSIATTAGGDLVVGGSARLDASGLWTNDAMGGAESNDPILPDGGSVSLSSSNNLTFSEGALIDVSAGARLYRDSKGAVKTTTGNAGSITLASGGLDPENRASATLHLGGDLHAYASSDGSKTGKGGKLVVSASNVSIGGTATGAAGELHLDQGFFQRGGFKDFEINGNDGLSVADGTVVAAQPQSRVLARNALMQGSGAALAGFTGLQVLAPELRSAGSVRLTAKSVKFGDLTVGDAALAAKDRKGVSVLSEAGGSIALVAGHRMMIDGTLQALGGNINLSLLAPQKNADSSDPAFDPASSIWLTANSSLTAGGIFKRDPKVVARIAGEVLGGGKVVVDAASGYLVTETGSLIDASGTSALLDRRGESGAYERTSVASAGGSIELSAREGMLLDGTLQAAAGGGGTSGGSLSVALDRNDANWAVTGVNAVDKALAGKRQVLLAATHNAGTGALTRGQALDPVSYSGRVVLGADKVRAGGFSSLALHAQNEVGVTGVFTLDLSRSLSIDAPNLSAAAASLVTLSAGQVLLGNSLNRAAAEALGGTGELTLKGDLVDLLGSVATQGIGKLTLDSSGDLRLRGVVDGTALRGKLATAGDLDVKAAQVYPTTLTEYELAVENNPGGKIEFFRVGDDLPTVLSAGGKLIVSAPEIKQGGVLKAPFGSIELRGDALTGSVALEKDSLTSVSGAGLEVPFGQTGLSGREWVYLLSREKNKDTGEINEVFRSITLPPEKSVQLSANTVTTKTGATVDLSGGGDLKAWEFTAGRGGSKDVLDALVSPNTFAIVPAIGNAYAPFDQQSSLSGTLKAGDRITLLASGGGLPAGQYTLLPARYALLAGAYTVTFKGSSLDGAGAAIAQTDGSVLGSAIRTAAVQGGGSVATSARIEQVEIASADIARSKSAYSETLASNFFKDAAGARLPGDAGRLAVKAGAAMTLEATIAAAHASGHRGAEVDLAAKNISVVGAGESAVPGSVAIDLASLNRIGADSLLLGGLRSHGTNGTTIEVVAETLDIKTGSSIDPATGKASALTAPELIAVASDTLSVHAGSTVEGTASAGGGSADKLLLSGDGALLRVSGGAQSDLARSTVSGSKGVLDVQAGSAVKGVAVTFDATKKTDFKGTLTLAEQGALAISARRISVGTASASEGIIFSNSDLAGLGNPNALRLTSYTTIDLYGAAQIGTASLAELTLQAAGIAGYGSAGQIATVSAGTVRMNNPAGTALPKVTPTGSGTLAIDAGKVEFGAGSFATQGYSAVKVTASEEIRVAGSGRDTDGKLGGHEIKGGTLTLSAPRITAATGADQRLSAAGKVTTVGTALPAGKTFAVDGIGGKLEIAGSSIEHGGRIYLPAGELTLAANGAAASDGVALLAGSQINATGVAKTFADVVVAAAAGTVRLKSENGGVSIADADTASGKAKALIDVSGVSGGDAGSIEVSAAKGNLVMAGELRGKALPRDSGGSPRQGRFAADARSLGDFNALNLALEKAAFTESRIFRQRVGSVVVGADALAKFTARNFRLETDAGDISVNGTIDASGAKGGNIELWAGRDGVGASAVGGHVTLNAGSALLARGEQMVTGTGEGTAGQGGSVVIGVGARDAAEEMNTGIVTEGAKADLPGALIDVGVNPGSQASPGKVMFSVPRQDIAGTQLKTLGSVVINHGDSLIAFDNSKVYSDISLSSSGAISTLQTGLLIGYRPAADFSGAQTINVDGEGAREIRQADGSALLDGTLKSSTALSLVFDGSQFRIAPASINDTGTASEYKVALATKPTSLLAGQVVTFKAKTNNAAGGMFLTLNGDSALKAKLVNLDGSDFSAGSIRANQVVTAVYDGTQFKVQSVAAIAMTNTTSGTNISLASTGMTAYQAGMGVAFRAAANNSTGALSVNVDGKGAIPLMRADGSALVSGDVVKDRLLFAVYDGSVFRLAGSALTDTGASGNTYAVTLPGTAPAALVTGQEVMFRAKNASAAGDVSLTLNSKLTANLVDVNGQSLGVGKIARDQWVKAVYDGKNFVLVDNILENMAAPVVAAVASSLWAPTRLEGGIVGAGQTALVGNQVIRETGNVLLESSRVSAFEAQLKQGMSNAADVKALRDPTGLLGLTLKAGLEIRADGDMRVLSPWDLLNARYDGSAGVLTLRATGDLKMEANLSDGFLAAPLTGSYQQNLLLGGDSWSYRLVAGADTGGANPLSLAASKGNVTIGNSYVRTGAGDIDIAAAGDIALLHANSAVYTAGIGDRSVEMPFFWAVTSSNTNGKGRAEFGKNGGDLRLTADGDIYSVDKKTTAAETAASKGVGKWLISFGELKGSGVNQGATGATWWTQLKNFSQGFGVLGGGDLIASAGGNIANAAFVSPTNGRLYTAPGATTDPADLVVMGGGDVTVRAGGNIDSILLLAGTGTAQVDAGGAMDTKSTKAGYNRFLLGDAVLDVSSRGQMNVGAVGSPTMQSGVEKDQGSLMPYFFTYTDRTAASFLSSASGVSLAAGMVGSSPTDQVDARYPGTVRAAALGGDLKTTALTMAPSASGQLELLASGAVVFSGKVAMSDTDASRIASPWMPQGTIKAAENTVGVGKNRDPDLLHRKDLQPNRIVAGGDIVGLENGVTALSSPKSVLIDAGGDIRNFTVEAENMRASDVSRMIAGGDISYSANTNQGVAGGFILGGTGRGEVIAGKSIDLSNNLGIVSRGNLSNPYLPEQGASLMVMAGSRAIDLDALKTFLSGTDFDAMPKQAFDAAVTSFMRQRSGNPALDDAAAQAAFATLSTTEQAPALRQALFAVLAKAGEAGTVSGDRAEYAAGYAALAAAFPGTPAAVPEIGASLPGTPYKGDINLFFSQIKTEMGGDIELFAPGGKINAGLANAGAGEKKAYELGVMTLGGGDINAYSLDSFEVNQSRVFTLGGGDIMLWSSYGGLDAGNGKKTAAAAPPALPRWDPAKQAFVLDASNSISGSGIGVLLGKPGIAEGDVGLFAPIGEVNAGDAGIRSLGKVIIGANSVVGAGNIQGSQVVGAPVAPSAAAPSLSGVGNAAGDAARGAEQQTQAGGQAQNRAQQASLINVEVLALGEVGDAVPGVPTATRTAAGGQAPAASSDSAGMPDDVRKKRK